MRTSGDGTVPYQSLRYSKTWDSPSFSSQCVELSGKEHEHREILASKKFHNVLTEYLTETVVICTPLLQFAVVWSALCHVPCMDWMCLA